LSDPAGAGTAALFGPPVAEELELALASELLEARTDRDVGRILGRVHRAVGIGACSTSPTGRSLAGIVGPFVGQTIRSLGLASGGRSSTLGGNEARASRLLGLELEGLSPEDREFAIARQLVRFAGTAARIACTAPPGPPPRQQARRAAAAAARAFAPGLLPMLRRTAPPIRSSTHPARAAGLRWPRTGRWLRRGRTIVLLT
jgi:hypothetical protein